MDTQVEWIDGGEGLFDWLDQAGLVPAETLKRLKAQAMPGELDNVASQARSLREWFRTFVGERRGRQLKSENLAALEPLNRLLERDETFTRIAVHPGRNSPLSLQLERRRCSMAIYGNRAKQVAHRSRAKSRVQA
ncbi:MAG: Zn-ribbon-like motif-containing protein [Reyranella sp.]|nr:Zn-ribbon-like motif-containing protein [Reyranella sp.]